VPGKIAEFCCIDGILESKICCYPPLPMFELEIPPNSRNFRLIEDYWYWLWNWR